MKAKHKVLYYGFQGIGHSGYVTDVDCDCDLKYSDNCGRRRTWVRDRYGLDPAPLVAISIDSKSW